jgi:hypothetical protein
LHILIFKFLLHTKPNFTLTVGPSPPPFFFPEYCLEYCLETVIGEGLSKAMNESYSVFDMPHLTNGWLPEEWRSTMYQTI